MLHNLESNPEPDAGAAFSDVAVEDWYAPAVAWAADAGIISGYGNGAFGPGDPITREQLAVMLYWYAQGSGYDVTARAGLDDYADAGAVSGYALEALSWASAAGIVTGTGGSMLNPRAPPPGPRPPPCSSGSVSTS